MFHTEGADVQTDRHTYITKLRVAFRYFYPKWHNNHGSLYTYVFTVNLTTMTIAKVTISKVTFEWRADE